MLYCILGPLGSGKTSVIDALVANGVCKRLTMETTNSLISNKDKSYITAPEENARAAMFWGGVVEVRRYVIGDDYSYFCYTPKNSMEKIYTDDYIVKCTPAQFSSYYKSYRGYVFPIILVSSDEERLLREVLICKTTIKSLCKKFIDDPYEVSSDIFMGVNYCHTIKNEDLDATINSIGNLITKNKNSDLYYTLSDTTLTYQELFDGKTFESLKNVIDLEVQIL